MPGGGAREPYHHGDLRNALCRHALRTIEAEGAGALSLRDAARALGVSPSAVYRHFEDKAALIAAVVDDGYARMTRAMESAARTAEQRALSGREGRAMLMAMGMSYVRFAAAHPTHFQTMMEAPPEAGRGPRDLLVRGVDRALGSSGTAPERRALRRAVFAVIHGLAVMVAQGPPSEREPSSCDAAAREVLEIVLRGAQR
ncbi:MAG: TetR/AcrR family transcriptional regulator, partial [Polyangiaceae bacterium]